MQIFLSESWSCKSFYRRAGLANCETCLNRDNNIVIKVTTTIIKIIIAISELILGI
ncbi:hypothetical protein DPMN_117233 [Dreissena polymorpha]|uniref:Uncharacterized protein n=1 Tax=Dreissena polymorpha TaxID=45954 RepID=A0A9D4QU91_DREPO|nr:hypothetical protein DPMN_117233 [Dreissena polymorpha]